MDDFNTMLVSLAIALISALPGLRALRIQEQSRQDQKKKEELQARAIDEDISDKIIARANRYIDELELINQELRAENRALSKWKIKALEYILDLFRIASKNEWLLIEHKIEIENPTPDLPEWFSNGDKK